MNVRSYLEETISNDGAAHLTLIDPDEQEPEVAGRIASLADSAGTNGVMIGGSTSAEGSILNETVREIKKNTDKPAILFPASEGGISPEADAIFFMSLLNSEDPTYITRAQAKGAPFVKKFDIEPISLAYLIIEPGGTVGRVGKADLIARDDIDTALGYSLASKYFGMSSIYLEAGSGADKPVSLEMIKAVKDTVGSLLIVGGGIRTPKAAAERVEAGADIIVTGTLVEKAENKFEKVENLIEAMKE